MQPAESTLAINQANFDHAEFVVVAYPATTRFAQHTFIAVLVHLKQDNPQIFTAALANENDHLELQAHWENLEDRFEVGHRYSIGAFESFQQVVSQFRHYIDHSLYGNQAGLYLGMLCRPLLGRPCANTVEALEATLIRAIRSSPQNSTQGS